MVKQQLRTAFPNPHCIDTALAMQTAENRMGCRAHQPLTQYLPTLLFLAFDTALQCGSIGLTPLMWRELGWLTENWHPSRKKGRPAVFTDVQPFQHFHPFSSSSRERIILPSKIVFHFFSSRDVITNCSGRFKCNMHSLNIWSRQPVYYLLHRQFGWLGGWWWWWWWWTGHSQQMITSFMNTLNNASFALPQSAYLSIKCKANVSVQWIKCSCSAMQTGDDLIAVQCIFSD